MRNFWILIGLEQQYFSINGIWNTYMWKLQTVAGSSINKYKHDLYGIFGKNTTHDISKLSQISQAVT